MYLNKVKKAAMGGGSTLTNRFMCLKLKTQLWLLQNFIHDITFMIQAIRVSFIS